MKKKDGYIVVRLSQEEVDALPAGSEIEVSWEYGSGHYFSYWTFRDYLDQVRVINTGSLNPLRHRFLDCPIVSGVTLGPEPEMVRVYGYKVDPTHIPSGRGMEHLNHQFCDIHNQWEASV